MHSVPWDSALKSHPQGAPVFFHTASVSFIKVFEAGIVILAVGRLRQEDHHGFEARLSYRIKACQRSGVIAQHLKTLAILPEDSLHSGVGRGVREVKTQRHNMSSTGLETASSEQKSTGVSTTSIS